MYQGTSTPFGTWSAAALTDMGAALNPEPVAELAGYFRGLMDTAADASAEIAATKAMLLEAHEGVAAQAVQTHLGRLLAVAEVGQGQALQASVALADQADYAAWARTRLAAAEGLREPTGGLAPTGFPNVAAAYENEVNLVRDAAAVYETNTNVNYAANFQPYDPPPDLAVDTAAWPGGGSGGGGAGFGGAGAVPAGLGAVPGGPGPTPGAGPAASGAGLPSGALTSGAPTPGAFPPGSGPGGPLGSGVGVPAVVPGATAAGAPLTSAGARGGPGVGGLRGPGTPGDVGSAALPGGTSRSLDGAAFGPGAAFPPGAGFGPGSAGSGPGARPPLGGPGVGARGGVGGPGSGLRGIGGPGGPGSPGGPGAGGPTDAASRAATGSGGRTGLYGAPMLGAGAGAGRPEETRRRPPWLVEDDPDEIWFAGLPPHTEPVISARQPGADGPPARDR